MGDWQKVREWNYNGLDCVVCLIDHRLSEESLATIEDPVVREHMNNGLLYHTGYVRIPKWHQWYGVRYDDPIPGEPAAYERPVEGMGAMLAVLFGGVDDYLHTLDGHVVIHGGLTWSKEHEGLGPGWWLGFDCGHAGDSINVWTEERTAEEVRNLARQVLAWKRRPLALLPVKASGS